jgi:hypothetical protein
MSGEGGGVWGGEGMSEEGGGVGWGEDELGGGEELGGVRRSWVG